MRPVRTQEVAPRLARQGPVGDVASPALEHALVLEPALVAAERGGHENLILETKSPLARALSLARVLALGQGDEDAAGGVVKKRRPDRPFPPACRPGRALVVPDHDQVGADVLRSAADFFHRLAHREMPGGLETLVGE